MRDRAEQKMWSDFQAWCRSRRLRPIPAHPWTVAAYARWCEVRHRLPTIVKRIGVIDKVHVDRNQEPPGGHPVVSRTLRMIEARRNRKRAKEKPLFRDTDFLETERPPPEPKKRRTALGSTPKLVRKRPRASGA